jgi:hypothetical protein
VLICLLMELVQHRRIGAPSGARIATTGNGDDDGNPDGVECKCMGRPGKARCAAASTDRGDRRDSSRLVAGAEPKIPPLLHNCVTPLTVRIEPISCIDTPSPLPQQLGMPTVVSLEGLENDENGVWFIKLWSAGWVQSMAAAARVSAHPTPHVALDIFIGRGRRRSSALPPPPMPPSDLHWRAPYLRMPFIDLLGGAHRLCAAADLLVALISP